MKKGLMMIVGCLVSLSAFSQSAQFYLHCSNAIQPEAYGLDADQPIVPGSQVRLLEGTDAPAMQIMPMTSPFRLKGSSLSTGEDTVIVLQAVTPPLPRFELSQNGQVITAQDIRPDTMYYLRLRPDSAFAAACPRDTSYQFGKGTLCIQYSLSAQTIRMKMGEVNDEGIGGQTIPIRQSRNSRQGTQWIELESVYRVNAIGQKGRVAFSAADLRIRL